MYNCHDGGAHPANTPHRPGPGKATVQRLRSRSVSPPAPAASMLGQRVRRWRSTEAADYNITLAGNIIYIFFVLNIYELEPAAPNTQK